MDASVPSVIGGCADALKACDWVISRRAVARGFLSNPNHGEGDATTNRGNRTNASKSRRTNYILI
jgi:hypothetical protein